MSKSNKDNSVKVAKKDKSQKKKKGTQEDVDAEELNTTTHTSKKSSFHKEDSDNEFDPSHDDPDMHDDIYIPKKKNKKTNEKGKATKVENAAEELKPSNKRKGKQIVDEPQPEPSDDEDDDVHSDEDVEDDDQEPKISKKQMKKKLKAERFNNTDQPAADSERGIIYVGRLPYGFVEEGLKEYFSQYGEILNINLARSKKTARPKGYAFIEFKNKDVAKIAAENMNGYMIFGKVLQCRLITDDAGMKVKTQKFKFIPHAKIFVDNYNKEKDSKIVKKEVKSLLKHEEKKRQKLKDLGIDYEFPGFKSLVGSA